MLDVLYIIFVSLYVFFLPGFLFSRRVYVEMDPVESVALGLGMSLLLVPTLSFSAAVLTGTEVTEGLVILSATAIILLSTPHKEWLEYAKTTVGRSQGP